MFLASAIFRLATSAIPRCCYGNDLVTVRPQFGTTMNLETEVSMDVQSPTFGSQAMALALPDYLMRIQGLRALQIGEVSLRLAVADPLGGRASRVKRDTDLAYRHSN